MPPFTKVLVANRGEIAVRVLRTLRELGIGTGRGVLGGRSRARCTSPSPTRRTCSGPGRRASRICAATRSSRSPSARAPTRSIPATASSPRTRTSRAASRRPGSSWIGPPPEAIEAMGSKIAARERMRAAGVPVVPGTTAPATSVDGRARGRGRGRLSDRGQGVGRRRREGAARRALAPTRSSAPSRPRGARARRTSPTPPCTSSATSTIRGTSRCRSSPTRHGNVIHLGERDCTIQRRHQKLVEETPSPAVDAELRARIGAIAVDAARAVDYRSAGTIEGLLDADGSYYFLEMNTRVQVEHTVTEAVTGIDIVREQIRVAAGEPLSVTQDGRRAPRACDRVPDQRRGRRARVSSRRPGGSRPTASPRASACASTPACASGDEISELYDPLIAKLIVHDVDREHARRRMLRALEEFVIEGPTTLLGFHRALLETPCFVAGGTCDGVVESEELAHRAQELEEQLSHRQSERGSRGGRTRRRRGARPGRHRRDRRPSARGPHPRPGAAVGRARAPSPGAEQGHRRRRDRRRRRARCREPCSRSRSPRAARSRRASSSASSRR